MKSLFSALLLLTSLSVHAFGFDASVGKTIRTHNLSYSFGIHHEMFGQTVRFGYQNLGRPSINRLAGADAMSDDIGTGVGPGPYYWFEPTPIKEVYLVVDHDVSKDWGYGIGLSAYHPQFQQDVNATEVVLRQRGRTFFSPVFEVYSGSLVLSSQWIRNYGDDQKYNAYNCLKINIGYRF